MILISRVPGLFGAKGLTLAPWLILLHPTRRGDAALIAHEQTHARQQREVGTVRWWWKYLLQAAFRQAQEVEAYQVQIQHGAALEACARDLVALYRLHIDLPAARVLLRSGGK